MSTLQRTTFLLIFSFAVCIPAKALPADDLDSIKSTIFTWRDAWQNKDIHQFLSFYSPDFRSNAFDYPGLVKKKTRLIQNADTLSVEISDLKIHIQGQRAAATFLQRYQSSTHADVGVKTLILKKTDQTWKIISEGWRPLKTGDQMVTTPGITAPTILSASIQPKVKRIDFKVEENGTERVIITANHFALPTVLTLEGTKPRIAIDFENIASREVKRLVRTNGKLIRQIRSYLYRNTKKLRIVLDLDLANDYAVKPTYQERENTYTIHVRPLSDVRKKTEFHTEEVLMSKIISEEWKPLLEGDKTTEEPAISSPSDALMVKRIDFKIEEDGAEKIFIAMNRFTIPEVMALEGLKPRIAIDIKNVHSWDGKPESQVNGKLIKQIRTHLYHDTKKLRIVLDLDADGDYSVNPIYYESDHIYCIEVKPQ